MNFIQFLYSINDAKNMVTFPEEPRPLAVKRTISHRRWLNGEKTDFTKF